MKKLFKNGIMAMLAMFVAASVIPSYAATVNAEKNICPVTGGNHSIVQVGYKKPLYTEAGYEAYEYCTQDDCDYTTFKAIPPLGEPEINDYGEFIENLTLLEVLANEYCLAYPGNDPLELIIKYIRTGVERYNSGSWGIMAGYESKEFADFIRRTENSFNYEIENVEDYFKFTALKNINEFYLPNGDLVDFGHMFGTLDISYTNKNSQNHADVGGWAGDLVDLISSADAYGYDVSGSIEEMVSALNDRYFLYHPENAEDAFDMVDYIGDMDAYYIFNTVLGRKYGINEETGMGTLTEVIMEYFSDSLSQEDRAKYFLKNRLGNVGTREQVRKAVYNAYTGNKTVTTLEATREFKTTQENINNLRRAACYVFADYICSLAGDYVEIENNRYYTDFNIETSSLAPGVVHETHYATTADGKQIVYYLATADLSNENVTVYANYNENDPTLGWQMSRVLDQANAAQAKHSDPESDKYIENYQVVAAINADGFDMKTGKPGGLLVMNGEEYHPINSNGFFGITKDGKAVIGTTAEYKETYKDILRDGVGAFGITLIKNGKVTVAHKDGYTDDRASRTSVGITKTGKVVFMVLDGRQEPRSCGGSMQEIAQIMLEAGCVTAVNLDGGGSTTFVSKPEGEEELRVTSSPSDGYARSVSTSLMMVSTAPSSTKFDHARLDSEYSYATVGTPVKITAVALSATGNVVELPENCQWRIVTFANDATITEDGVFTGNRNWRDHEIELVCDGAVIGQTTIHVVSPNNLYFERKAMDAVYGTEIEIPVHAVYDGNAVAINENDVILTVDPARSGTFDGNTLQITETSNVKNATVIAMLKDDESIVSKMSINLYKQGENTFNFDKALGGDRQFAWDRQVTNAVTDDSVSYTAKNPEEEMETSYVFAIDMREIPIPSQLEDLTYMLPGADSSDASAWNFLLQLAERISVLTEVKPVIKIDDRFNVDYSGLEVISDYFYLDKENPTSFDAEKNELSITLRWHDQTASIPAATANPLCMLKGIKLIPKEGAYDAGKINVVHSGEVGYTIYLRANALYTFASKPENQEIYGLYSFINPDDPGEKGGYFHDVYNRFEDRYTLSRDKKNGWSNEDGGFAYYVDGERYTGVKFADGYYYDFGENGINVGQTKYTGFFTENEKTYYAEHGELVKSKWHFVGTEMYHCHADGDAYTTTVSDPITCIRGGSRTYTCKQCKQANRGGFIFPEGHTWDDNHKCKVCGTQGTDIANATINFGTVENPRTSTSIPRYELTSTGIRPTSYVSFDGKKALTKSNDATLNSDNTMRDLYISWTNDRGIGKAYVNYTGKGNYYGEGKLEYHILPASVKNFKAEAGITSVTLTWDKSLGADYYRLYKGANGGDWKVIQVTGTSYTITGLDPNTKYTFSIASSAKSTDGENKIYNCSKWANVTTTTLDQQVTAGLLSDVNAVVGEQEISMLTVESAKYLMIPGFANTNEFKLSFKANENANSQVLTISGDLGSTTSPFVAGDNVVTFDLSKIATMSDGKSTINFTIGSALPMEIVIMHGSNVPSMFITSDDEAKDRTFVDASKENKTTASMYMASATGDEIYNGILTEIKARGNSTFTYYDKKAYQIKLKDKTDLVGCGEKVKTWVLLANYGDATMMHDKFMKDVAKELGVEYALDSEWVNLWYDGEYRGTYLISEKVSVGSTSVDITDMEEAYEELNPDYGEEKSPSYGVNKYGKVYQYTADLTDPEDITGGYLIELNLKKIDEVNGFMTKKGVAFNVKSPEWISESAIKYISEYYQEFEDAVYAQKDGVYTGYNEATGKYFYEYVDLDSLVKIFSIQEIGLNPDGFNSSLYFNKDVNGIMKVGPVWDQDMTLGTGWTKYIAPSIQDYHYLAEALIKIPIFKARVANFFGDEAVAIIEEAISEGGTIDNNYEKLSESAQMNYTLWPYVRVGNPQNSNHLWKDADYDAVVSDMKSWITSRLGYLKDRLIVDADHEAVYGSWTTVDSETHEARCLCGDVIIEPHVWDDGVITTQPGEYTEGILTYTCICGEEKTETLEATGHSHSMSFNEEVPATCSEDGIKAHYICSECGKTYEDEAGEVEIKDLVIPATEEHEYEGVVTQPATHTEAGIMTYTCICGDTYTEEIPADADAHEWDEGVVTVEPTETEEGVMTYTCICGEHKTESIAVIGHSHIMSYNEEVPATCAENGTKAHYICSGCGKTYEDEAGEVEIEDLVIPATEEHEYGEFVEVDEYTHKKECECGEAIIEDHNLGDGVVTKEPTETETGIMTYVCSECGYENVEEIPATGESTSGGSTTGESTTGESTSGGSTTGGNTTGGSTTGGSTTGGSTTGGSTTGGSTTGGSTTGGSTTGGSTTGGSTTGGSTTGGSTTGGSTTGGSTTGGSTTGESTTGGSTTGGSTTGGNTTGGETGGTTGGNTPGGEQGGNTPGGDDSDDPCKGGHLYGDWEPNGTSKHKRTCEVCGHLQTQGHRWDAGVVTKPATSTATGTRKHTCKDCDATKTTTIPKTSGGNSSSGSSGNSSDTETETKKYTVKFNTNGGSTVKAVTVKQNQCVSKPSNPTKAGYEFEGWYTDSKLTNKYNFNLRVTKNLTLYAKWTKTSKEDDPKAEEPKTDKPKEEQKPETPKTEDVAIVGNFKDVKQNVWFASSVKFAVDNKLMAGVSETEFAPDMNLTRAMIVTVLYRLEGEPDTDGNKPFADIDMGSYYANAVAWAKQNGIVSGISETEFAPDVNITREQIVAIFYRYATFKGYNVSAGDGADIDAYDDAKNVSAFANNSMKYAVGSGLIKGKTEKTLNPKDNATRAEFAAIIERFIKANR